MALFEKAYSLSNPDKIVQFVVDDPAYLEGLGRVDGVDLE